MPEPHEILGVPRHATPEQVRKAYRSLARRFHPDASGTSDTGARFAEITAAYEQMGNLQHTTAQRADHSQGEDNGWDEEIDPSVCYDTFFSASAPSRQSKPAPFRRRGTGLDVEVELPLRSEEFAAGGVFTAPSPIGPVEIQLGPSTPVNREIRVPDAGVLGPDRKRGDLFVILTAINPSGDTLEL